MKNCPIQEVCHHYTNGTKRRPHHVRLEDPCKHWLAMDCKSMVQWVEILSVHTGKVFACNIEKVKRIKEGK